MTPDERQKLDYVYDTLKKMEVAYSIPLNIRQALQEGLDVGSTLETSAKSSSSENQAVNEGGVATYSVMKTPDGFLQITLNGTLYYLPYFS